VIVVSVFAVRMIIIIFVIIVTAVAFAFSSAVGATGATFRGWFAAGVFDFAGAFAFCVALGLAAAFDFAGLIFAAAGIVVFQPLRFGFW